MKIPDSIKKFAEVFSEIPGIGPRQAIRLAFYFINQGIGFNEKVIRAVLSIKDIKLCSQCFNIHQNKTNPRPEDNLCEICADPKRDKNTIAIVEKETDLLSIENTSKFKGKYLILGDLKKSGVLDIQQKLRISSLKSFVKKQNYLFEEIIIAVNPTTYGDLNADIIAKELKPFAKKISRLGKGIPTGGEIEFADKETLSEAIERRK
ncbi:MAG: toprim domain-containing protein [Candidatus Liptonbacteria bacterium]|nr:toprim domain-containing protein [Candidatus Liptonbacteria bacterium]